MEAEQEISTSENDTKKAQKGSFSSLSSDRKYILLGLRIAADFGVAIAVPIVLFVLIGRWLDDKYESGPWYTIIAFILAALISGFIIYKKAKKYGEEYNNLEKRGQ